MLTRLHSEVKIITTNDTISEMPLCYDAMFCAFYAVGICNTILPYLKAKHLMAAYVILL